MNELRKQFEALPEIDEKMVSYKISFDGGSYNSPFSHINAWMNGAWCLFQEQQKIIDDQNQRSIDQVAHLHRVQEHNAKLQKRLKENGIPWQDLI